MPESIGTVWRPAEARWMNGCRHAEAYMRHLNGTPHKNNYVSEDGYRTGARIRGQCRALNKGIATTEHKTLLKQLGFVGESKESEENQQKRVRNQANLPMRQSGQKQAQGILGK